PRNTATSQSAVRPISDRTRHGIPRRLTDPACYYGFTSAPWLLEPGLPTSEGFHPTAASPSSSLVWRRPRKSRVEVQGRTGRTGTRRAVAGQPTIGAGAAYPEHSC